MQREVDEIVVVSRKELDEKEDLIKSLEAKGQKMKSDFTRYKKRVEDREEEIRRKAYSELASRLLSVADTLDRAKNSYNADSGCEVVEKMAEGTRSNLEMTFNQLLNTLEVTAIAPSAGERFNDELHTAIETTPNNFLPDKTIVSLVRKGYMLDGELIRPAEVVISRGGGENEAGEAGSKQESMLSKFLRSVESRVFKRKFKELDERAEELEVGKQELRQNEEMLRRSVNELDVREEEFKTRVEEWTKRKETVESKVHELEQRRAALNAELEKLTRQLSVIHEDLEERYAKKDKIVIECIALSRYNEELLEQREEVLREIEERERTTEALNAGLKGMEEKKVWCREEILRIEEELRESKESANAELIAMEERKMESIEELLKVREELEKAKELLNIELREEEKEEAKEEKSEVLPFIEEFEMAC